MEVGIKVALLDIMTAILTVTMIVFLLHQEKFLHSLNLIPGLILSYCGLSQYLDEKNNNSFVWFKNVLSSK